TFTQAMLRRRRYHLPAGRRSGRTWYRSATALAVIAATIRSSNPRSLVSVGGFTRRASRSAARLRRRGATQSPQRSGPSAGDRRAPDVLRTRRGYDARALWPARATTRPAGQG